MVDEYIRNGWLKQADALSENGIKELIKANDPESVTLGQELITLKVEDALIEGLNVDQTTAFVNIIDFFRNGNREGIVLKGYAGTGKTFLVRRVIEYVTNIYPYRKVAVTAPTNKAVEVLVKNAPFEDDDEPVVVDAFDGGKSITYTTVHKLLGLKEQVDASGNRTFVSDKNDKRNKILEYDYLILDEVSMLPDALYAEIMKYSDRVKIIFMGDPCQIPPIGKLDCLPFSEDPGFDLQILELTEIMRQKGTNAIVDCSMIIRKSINNPQVLPGLKTDLNDKEDGIIVIDGKNPEERQGVKEILKTYYTSEAYKNNSDYMKTIAWTNNKVAISIRSLGVSYTEQRRIGL
jgi:exodeoxyribonuclease-5